jgi:hypothetical protein
VSGSPGPALGTGRLSGKTVLITGAGSGLGRIEVQVPLPLALELVKSYALVS